MTDGMSATSACGNFALAQCLSPESLIGYMHSNIPEPTSEMVAFFELRTKQHIDRVRACLEFLAEATNYGAELRERASIHDASKFEADERLPYIWLTEYHRRRRTNDPMEYPAGVAKQVERAIQHHLTVNRHHPEFHSDPNQMSDVDLIEMVCDWAAMAQEFGQDGGSARNWADKTIGHRVGFNAEKQRYIYEIIDLLDNEIAVEGSHRKLKSSAE